MLDCEICHDDFRERYGELWHECALHVCPRPTLAAAGVVPTKLDELVLLCGNSAALVFQSADIVGNFAQLRERFLFLIFRQNDSVAAFGVTGFFGVILPQFGIGLGAKASPLVLANKKLVTAAASRRPPPCNLCR